MGSRRALRVEMSEEISLVPSSFLRITINIYLLNGYFLMCLSLLLLVLFCRGVRMLRLLSLSSCWCCIFLLLFRLIKRVLVVLNEFLCFQDLVHIQPELLSKFI